jgi:long-subunit fatty acid transport protein
MSVKQIALTINLFFLSIAQILLAGDTNFLPIFGGRTFARNGLYFAGSDGLASAVANPATLIYGDERLVQFTLIDRAGRQELDSPSDGLFRSFRSNDFAFAGGALWRVSDNLAAGLTYYRAADYRVDWPFAMFRERPGSSVVLVFELVNQLRIDAIAPVVAYKFGKLALGVTLNIYRFDHRLAFPIANAAWLQGRGQSAYQFVYDQDAWTYAPNIGTSFDLSGKLRLAATLRIGYSGDLEGTALSNMFADTALFNPAAPSQVVVSSEFNTPWSLGAGIAYKLSERSEFNFDVMYNLWSGRQSGMQFEFGNDTWQNGLATLDTVTGFNGRHFSLNYDNTLDIGIGYEYAPPEGLTYRAGYRFSKSPNSAETYSLLFPGVHQHWFTAGFGYQSGRFTLDAALAYAIGQSRQIDLPASGMSAGTYNSNVILPVASIRYRL